MFIIIQVGVLRHPHWDPVFLVAVQVSQLNTVWRLSALVAVKNIAGWKQNWSLAV